MIAGLMCLLIVGLMVFVGCKKKEEPAGSSATQTLAKQAAEKQTEAKEAIESAVAAIEQTECPVMGGAINKDIFVEYQGQKVYFCCEPCKEKFTKAPEQYLAKLPQFKKEQ